MFIYEVIASKKHGKWSSRASGGVLCNSVLKYDGLMADKHNVNETDLFFELKKGSINTALETRWKDNTELFSGNCW